MTLSFDYQLALFGNEPAREAGRWGENEELRKKSLRWYFFMQVLWRATNVAFYEEIFNPPFTAPFNNMRALKFNAQPTNAFFASVNKMFGGSSHLPTTAESEVIKSLSTVQTTPVLGSSWKLGGAAEHLIDGSEKRICRLSFGFQESACYGKAQ